MIKIGQFLYLIGILLTAKLGYAQLPWYYLFAGSILLSLGWIFVRAPQLYSLLQSDGILGIIKLVSIQLMIMSVISGPIYLISYLIG